MTAREAAQKALMAYRRKGARPEITLGAVIDGAELSTRDAALASRLTGGVLQNMALCDYYIASYSSVKIGKIEPRVLDILRISVYQLVFLSKVPPSAAVNEGVALAGRHNPRVKGFVNAVLRKISDAAQNGTLPVPAADSEAERLSILYSHPEWLVREFIAVLGVNGAEALLRANNDAEIPVTAQVNTLRATVEGVLEQLTECGIAASRHRMLDGAVELRGAGSIEKLDAHKSGLFYVQDAAARISVTVSGVKPGDFVLDACAAPGGKSFAAAITMNNKGRIDACDINEAKLHRISDGAERLGISVVTARALDASVYVPEYEGRADVVLADVPCSGLGVIRKKPEIRYKTEQDIAGLPELQKRILMNLSSYVKPGGVLLYSTCTVLERENEGVIKAFLAEKRYFTPESFTIPGIGAVPDGKITLWPQLHGTDGFFICKLRRRV